MSRIQDRCNGAIRICKQVCTVGWRCPACAVDIQLLIQLTNRRVGRQRLRVTSPIEVDLCLSIGEGVDIDAEAWRPVVVEDILLVWSVELFLFPPKTGIVGDTPI